MSTARPGRWLMLMVFCALITGCAALGARRPPPPTLDEIVQSSKDGAPPEVIIRRMKESWAVYALSASEIAKLHEEGVADAVLDYMQATYLDAVRQEERMRWSMYYDAWDPWWPGWGPRLHRLAPFRP